MKTQTTLQGKSDITTKNWILRNAPLSIRPYILLARLDRPIGIWLLLLPGLWSIWLAAERFEPKALWISLLFLIGAITMRAAGCVINDIWDRDLDKQVERTRIRPLASGQVIIRHAVIYLLGLLIIGLAILLQMNTLTIILGICALPLIIAYPLMKRITWWPQAFLGLTFNAGALMGWAAMEGSVGLSALLLYIGGIFWTLGYDTIYAHQDIEDDIMAGIKSTARKFGNFSKYWVVGFYTLATLCIATAAALVNIWGCVLLLPMALHFYWQISEWKLADAASSLCIFKSNRDCGLLILVVIVLLSLI